MQQTQCDSDKSTMVIVALNGARKTKQDHPNLPITVEEIVKEVKGCVEAGAAMVHLHARNQEGLHSLEIDDNALILDVVREQVGDNVIIQLTTEAVGMYPPQQQMDLIKALKPEAASFAISELIPSKNQEIAASKFFHWVAEEGIIAQYILYSEQQFEYYLDLVERNILPNHHHHILIVLGRYDKNQQSDPSELAPFVPLVEKLNGTRWAVCAFGEKEQACLLEAAKLGADIRIGFENNLYDTEGHLAENNLQQVTAINAKLEESGHYLLSARDSRAMFVK
ncbi:3-keto-5-aminohexanoate cleavage protein [Vibrio sp. RC27]